MTTKGILSKTQLYEMSWEVSSRPSSWVYGKEPKVNFKNLMETK